MYVQVYQDENGREPFITWLESIRDTRTRLRIRKRLRRVELGNFGDYRSVGDGIFELRFHFGPGYRVYFGRVGETVVLLLVGGDKGSQTRDIQRAKAYWHEYQRSQEHEKT